MYYYFAARTTIFNTNILRLHKIVVNEIIHFCKYVLSLLSNFINWYIIGGLQTFLPII